MYLLVLLVNISATCLNPLLGDDLGIFSRGHMQFGMQTFFIQELLLFLGSGHPKLFLLWCLFRTHFTIFKMIHDENLKSDQTMHLIGSFVQRLLSVMLQSMFASALII